MGRRWTGESEDSTYGSSLNKGMQKGQWVGGTLAIILVPLEDKDSGESPYRKKLGSEQLQNDFLMTV